jgi:hypothetical protein
MERRKFIKICACAAIYAAVQTPASVRASQSGDNTVIIEGIDKYRVTDPLFECVRVVLSHRGESYSPAYVQGISGAAFRIAGICPCAPTCSSAMSTEELIRLFGYQVEPYPFTDENPDLEKEVQTILARLKEEIRADRPVILWHAFTTAEWDVVCGFDEEQNQLIGRGSYKGLDAYAREDETRTIRFGPALGALFVGEKIGGFDSHATEISALKQAVAHARSTEGQDRLGGDKWAMLEGLLCYDRWVDEFTTDPERKRTMGDSYCLGVYRSTHRAAAGFTTELAPKYPEATQHFEKAAAQFTAEADALDLCNEHLGWQTPEGPDPERNAHAAELLSKARDSYAAGIDFIEKAIEAIG